MKRCPKCNNSFPDEANFCPVDAARLEPIVAAAAPADGLIGGRFQLGERLGGTRTGDVHAARDGSSGRPCVVKLVAENVFPSPLLAQRTERELKQLETLDSAHVVKVLAHGKQGSRLWIASEVAGGSLERMLAAQGPMDPARAAEVALAIGRGLADAARSGVVHRDLAPKNILVDGAEIKLINFGVPVPGSRDVQGVPEYVSPEQVEGKPVDQRSNIYSLGAIFYALLTGQPPYSGDTQMVHQQHLSATPRPTGVSTAIDVVVLKAMERQPAKRYMTLRQFLEELEKLAQTAHADGTQPLGMQYGVAAGGVGAAGSSGKTKKKALAQTMMGGFQALDPAPDKEPSTTQKMGSAPADAPSAAPAAPSGPHMAPSPAQLASLAVSATEPVPTPPVAAQPVAPPVAAPPVAAAPPMMAAPAPPPSMEPPPPSVSNPNMSKSNGQGQSAGKGKGKGAQTQKKEGGSKGKFRETMWFKKGELDAAAAAEAAKQKPSEMPAPDKADALPMEDRYGDDGSISTEDRGKYSLRTGHTQQMAAMRADQIPRPSKSQAPAVDDLVSEMKGNTWIYVVVAVVAVGIGLAVFFIVR
jgi:serine/threonine-protein kinase